MTFSIVVSFLLLFVAFGQDRSASFSSAGPIDVEGDTASRIVASLAGDDTLLVAGDEGLYERTESGWSMIAPAPPPGELVSGGAGSGLLLAGDHEPCGRGGSSLVLQRSTDGGETWQAVDGAAGYRPLAIWPDRGLALASSCLGLHLSHDAGLTWGPVAGIEPGWEITAFAAVPRAGDNGPVVLVSLTGEGGTSYLRSIDFSDPSMPMVSPDLRTYYAIGGLAGEGDTFVLAAMDGVWVSEDAGATWERSADGLDTVVLERDPAEFGFPPDLDPSAYGLTSVVFFPGETIDLLAGSVDGLYSRSVETGEWSHIGGTSGRVTGLLVANDGSLVVYETDEGVSQVKISAGS